MLSDSCIKFIPQVSDDVSLFRPLNIAGVLKSRSAISPNSYHSIIFLTICLFVFFVVVVFLIFRIRLVHVERQLHRKLMQGSFKSSPKSN